MKKNVLTIVSATILTIANQVSAQGYNRFSIDVEGGINRTMGPQTKGYFTNLAQPLHIKGGFRLMATPSFGFKAAYTYESFKGGTGSLPFVATANIGTLESVVNLGRLCRFEDFTKHIGLFLHGGMGIGFMQGVDPTAKVITDRFGSAVFGITPEFRLAEKFAFTLDISMYGNTRQDYAFDFQTRTDNRGFDGYFANISAGFSISLGGNDKNIDWKFYEDGSSARIDSLMNEVEALKRKTEANEAQLVEVDTKMLDDDADGVANYLDEEKETKEGVTVDTKGREVVMPKFDSLIGDTNPELKLFYTVQLGVFSREIPEKYWRNISPIYVLNIEDGTKRYFHDYFNSVEEATPSLNKAIKAGISDAFVTAYYKGKRIPISEAEMILKTEGPSVLRVKK